LVLAGDELQVIENAALVVQSGRIVRIGDPLPGSKVVDMRGKVLCPMFINAHTHVGDTGAKELGSGKSLPEVVIPPHGLKHRFLNALDSETQTTMMRHALKEMLFNGVIAHADFREQGLKGVRMLRRACEGLPLRTLILGRMEEKAPPEQTEAEAREILREADGIGVRDVRSYDLNVLARLRQAFPHQVFAAHASENREEEKLSISQTGRGQTARHIDWKPDFLVHLIYPPAEDIRRAAEQGIIGVACPRTNCIIGDGLPDLNLWQRCGLPFALGTDNMMFNSPDMLREMDYASRLTRGVHGDPTAIESLTVLKAATIVGARALRLDKELGSLAEGKEASFIAFDFQSPNLTYQQNIHSAIVHRATAADMAGIYVRGKPLEGYLSG